MISSFSQLQGRSKEGRPLKTVVLQNITELRTCEIELSQKQKILDDAIEQQENLREFFDNCPTMMGIIQLTDDGKIFVKYTNPATQEYYRKSYGSNIYEKEFNEEQLWIRKYLESKRSGRPVYFESPKTFQNTNKGKLNKKKL